MAVTVQSFLIRFPEFKGVPAEQVQDAMADAVLEIDTDVWGSKADIGVKLLTAHFLAMSPYGQNVRMTIPGTRNGRTEPTTTYWTFFKKVQNQVTSGFRVT